MRAAHRPSARKGVAPPRRRRSRGQRGMELRQGPVGVRVRDAGRPDRHAAGAGPGRQPTPSVVVGGRRGRRPRADRRGRTHRGAGRRQGNPRGCLRLCQVRPDRAGHQRHRLPHPRLLRRGVAVPRRRGGWATDDLGVRGHRIRTRGGPRRIRAGGGVADRLPAPAQGIPQARPQGDVDRAVRHPRPDQDGRQRDRHAARRRSGCTRRASR